MNIKKKKKKKPWTTTHKLQDNEGEGDSPIPSTFTLVTRIDDLIMYQFDVQFLCKIWKIKDKEQELLNMKISIFSVYLSIYMIWIYIYKTYQESNEG